MVIDEVHLIGGRVGGQHPGGERPLQAQRVRPVGQRTQPGPQRGQLRADRQPDRDTGVGPAQMLAALHGVDAQPETQGRGGQHRQIVVPARRPTGQRREDPLRRRPGPGTDAAASPRHTGTGSNRSRSGPTRRTADHSAHPPPRVLRLGVGTGVGFGRPRRLGRRLVPVGSGSVGSVSAPARFDVGAVRSAPAAAGQRCSAPEPRPVESSQRRTTERATPSRSAMACWVHPDPAQARARATCRPVSLGGRPRRRTSPAEPSRRARPRSIDTYVAVNPNTAATSSTRRPASVNATIARFRIPTSSAS